MGSSVAKRVSSARTPASVSAFSSVDLPAFVYLLRSFTPPLKSSDPVSYSAYNYMHSHVSIYITDQGAVLPQFELDPSLPHVFK